MTGVHYVLKCTKLNVIFALLASEAKYKLDYSFCVVKNNFKNISEI